jgi:TolB protein
VPGGNAICYNSYAIHDNPYIFYHNLKTGERPVIARYGGSSISPSVSPDGSKVAMVLSVGGRPNVYVADIDGKNVRQLTADPEDSSPCWSPDGRWVCFATKIDERRVLAKVAVGGGPIQRISTAGAPNPSEPDWSPDGKWIAFTSQSGNYFNICIIPAEGGTPVVITSGEDPSWAPNSRTLVFAKRNGYSYTLSVLDVFTKQFKDIARISGSDSEPSWAK